jgi:hypothetical protein
MASLTHEISRYYAVLHQLHRHLGAEINWAITGSLGFALQGVATLVRDIDVQTDGPGAFAIEKRFAAYVLKPVEFSATDRICSYFGALCIDGIIVEIMGDVQKRQPDGAWSMPADLKAHKRRVVVGGIMIPVLDLRFELAAYTQLARWDKVAQLQDHLARLEP